MCGAVNKQFGCKSVDDNAVGLNVWSAVQVGIGSASGAITDDSETDGLDNWELEVVGGTCGTAGRSGVSKNGSDE
jgi:hypothetical protein